MNPALLKRLSDLASAGVDQTFDGSDGWAARVSSFLRIAIGPDAAREFDKLYDSSWERCHGLRLGHVEGLLSLAEASRIPTDVGKADLGPTGRAEVMPEGAIIEESRKVFLVHGHDNGAKEGTARFLTKLGLDPIILHEQPSGGRTIIEKFETYSRGVAFAVVLLTPDDVGAAATDTAKLKGRARQNVILELGYFIGKLGRTSVCALYKGSVELPSDYQGVIYIEMDQGGAWKAKLAQELVQSKVPIELAGLLEA